MWSFCRRWSDYPLQSEPLWDRGNRVLLSTMARCHFFLPLRKRENQQFWLPFPWIHNKHVMALSYPLALRQGCIPAFCILMPVETCLSRIAEFKIMLAYFFCSCYWILLVCSGSHRGKTVPEWHLYTKQWIIFSRQTSKQKNKKEKHYECKTYILKSLNYS